MILAIDAGNTSIKWGLHDGRHWVDHGAVPKADLLRLNDFLKLIGPPAMIVISNVAGELIRSKLTVMLSRWRVTPLWIAARPAQCGVTNGYENPAQLGCDRWAALIAARHLQQGPALVVMAGTAMTVDALNAQGKFLGGLIVPGFHLMTEAIHGKTAGVRVEPGMFQWFPTNTANAVHSGVLQAATGAIERMWEALQHETDLEPALILSGGGAEALAPLLSVPPIRVDNLVLEGLILIGSL